jgi:thymidylate synthase ThyX
VSAPHATLDGPMDYPVESFTPEERKRLEPHFTNLDQPVFALVNLPETVKGALFARYSRYPGTLRRLFLDEFADSLPELPAAFEGSEGKRAADLYERVFLEYGDDSVAQLGGAHVAVEWCSNVLTKILQRPRLAAYLEQSTRYIAYDRPMDDAGAWRYFRHPGLGPEYERAMDRLFELYSDSLARVRAWVESTFPPPKPGADAAHRRAVNAKALDLVRGMLPAASLSHVGVFASGQAYEQLILHLLAHPLPEAQVYGEMILTELEKVMPSFLTRVRKPDRGGVWIEQLRSRRERSLDAAGRLGLRRDDLVEEPASVRLVDVDGDERRLLRALLAEEATVSEAEVADAVDRLDSEEAARTIAELVGERENRRHRPGRGFEALRYRFEIVSDYGAFRDLQRHRMLTAQWQELTPLLGADVPEEVGLAGAGAAYNEALEVSATAWRALRDAGQGPAAQYALCLAYRLRYVLDMNAREAMQLIELRSGDQGHPSYRAVAQEMHRLIAEVHPVVASAMTHVDLTTEPRLERLLAEMRTQAKREALQTDLAARRG